MELPWRAANAYLAVALLPMGPMEGLHYRHDRKSQMLSSLRGRAHIKIDSKGRISLPSSSRDVFAKSSQLVMTHNFTQGFRWLDIYSLTEWRKLEKRVAQMPHLKKEVQVFQRYYISAAEILAIDNQSRILVPQHLREYAGLNEDIVIVAMGVKFEIWSSTQWRSFFKQLENDFASSNEVVAELTSEKEK